MRNASMPVVLIVVGILGVVWYFGWLPDFDSITAIALVGAGIVVLAMDGITKNSVVLGPALIAFGIAWWVHDQYRYRWTLLIPMLLILIGGLMLIARRPSIPDRRGKSDAA
ncbi:MAG: hypothetical protein ABI607_07340 [Betaproteobacteria bacterium]